MRGVHELSHAAGLTCLEDVWKGARYGYSFRCQHGHEVVRRLDHLKARPFCLICAKVNRDQFGPFSRLLRDAAIAGVTCLDTKWLGAEHNYRYRCENGHEWSRKQIGSGKGRGCPVCSRIASNFQRRKNENLSKLNGIAQIHGGACLSTEYLGANQKYSFRCAQGHEWSAYPSVLKSGSWCKRCHFDSRLLGIEQAHEAAKARGGQCLSQNYVNSLSKLTWQCHRGHEWQAPLAAIRVGKWCKQCASMDRISNAKSKARIRYTDAGTRLFDTVTSKPAASRR